MDIKSEEINIVKINSKTDETLIVEKGTGKDELLVKILLSPHIAWSISKYAQSKVIWVFEKFGTDVRLSRNDDYYPCTTERVCLINGTADKISTTLDWICKISNDSQQVNEQIKILIPKTTLSNRNYLLKTFCDKETEVTILSQYNSDILREICASISGTNRTRIIKVCISIAKVIKLDPFCAICRNISYEEFNTYLNQKDIKKNSETCKFISKMSTNLNCYQQQISNYNYDNNYLAKNFSGPNLLNQQQQQSHPQIFEQPVQDSPEIITTAETTTTTTELEQGNDLGAEKECEESGGHPIPSLTTFWRRASSEHWRSGNYRVQSNLEIIPGFN